MSIFRIVKLETHNGRGESVVHYKIQKKFLFWFFDFRFNTHYYTWEDWSAQNNDEPVDGAMIAKRIFLFDTKAKAEEYLIKIQNPFKERYRGDMIITVFPENRLGDVFINKSHYGLRGYNRKPAYEYSYTLDGLKKMIDNRKTKIKISVV